MVIIIRFIKLRIIITEVKIIKKAIRIITAILSVFSILIFSFIVYGSKIIPDKISAPNDSIEYYEIYTVRNHSDRIATAFSYGKENFNNSNATVTLLNTFPVKEVNINKSNRKYLIPGGELVGIKLKTNGVLIVGTESFESEEGQVNPAYEAGIEIGDTLLSVDGKAVTTNGELSFIISNSGGKQLDLEILRNEKQIKLTLTPKKSSLTGLYKGGLWIRDSTGGIGTLTYADTQNGIAASLGHGIYDPDTGKLISVQEGEFQKAELNGIIKGTSGTAGELKGTIIGDPFGTIDINCENGIYGSLKFCDFCSEALPVADTSEVKTGYAEIISTVNGNEKEYFDIEIEKININSDNKNLIIRVTDESLLETTGGIVQGMSGSPIIQNGMIIGAVTHVFLNDPTKGYGILLENMLKQTS